MIWIKLVIEGEYIHGRIDTWLLNIKILDMMVGLVQEPRISLQDFKHSMIL